jgi:hypothetical protein
MLAPIRVQDVYSLVQQMIHSPADQVRLGAQLRSMVQSLPPPHNELISRYQFARAGLWSYVANFFEIEQGREQPVQVIRIPHDSWIRSVQAIALPRLDPDYVTANDLAVAARQRKLLNAATGSAWRGLIELNWRINARQGFISSGTGEVQSPAALVAGDGQYGADLDWRLQQEDTIEVRCRSRVGQVYAENVEPAIDRTLAWVCVVFWAEELPQP